MSLEVIESQHVSIGNYLPRTKITELYFDFDHPCRYGRGDLQNRNTCVCFHRDERPVHVAG